ncbi:conjugal transfer protein [Kyrpidia sp.]|uniref:conjugal transfer protein n=1 Tax=Kyrpidia sp. TaxID=2073077 RepID=UPI00258B6EE1|nr:conjugal transfer protein [Kyrpidia sp.]MCL6577668.1 conjugal transfer protein [Kyrpidia sp.]
MVRKLTSIALWILLALGALGGVGAITRMFAPAQADTAGPQDDHQVSAIALHAARVWLTVHKGESADERKAAVADLWPGLEPQDWTPPTQDQTPREMYVRDVSRPGPGFAVVSVDAWCDVSDGQKAQTRHLVLNVPIYRADTGYVITAPPTILPPPALGQKPAPAAKDAPQDVYDVATPFVSDFLRTFLTSSNPADLANMVVPGTAVQPMGGFVKFEKVADMKIRDLGKGHYEAVTTVNVLDPVTQTVLPEQFLVDFLRDDKGHLEVEKVWLH